MTTTTHIRMAEVAVGDTERRLVMDVLDSGRLAQGPMVERFEAALASTTGTAHAVAVNSGTAALVVALQSLGVGPGDEVVLPALTFGATLNAVIATGAVARVADVGPDFDLDPASLAERITDQTRAVLPVHLYGLPADLETIGRIAPAGALIVEDAAQAIGASIDGRSVGNADAGCFSFYATKNVMAGEGGAITTNDADTASRARMIRNQGMSDRYEYALTGLNWRMSDLHAAIGIGQLERLRDFTDRRRHNANMLDQALQPIPWIRTPIRHEGRRHVFHQYTVLLSEDAPVARNRLIDHLASHGVDTAVVYPRAVHDYECFRDHHLVADDDTPTARSMSDRVMSLPIHPGVGDADIERIGAVIAAAAQRRTRP